MSDDEDDYLSDKFLFPEPVPSTNSKTYSQRRKESERLATLRNEQNRKKSRRELELESREAGLSKSLFARAQEESSAGVGSQNKALAMMMKMGFKPGQALGQPEQEPSTSKTHPVAVSIYDDEDDVAQTSKEGSAEGSASGLSKETKTSSRHLIAPLPLNEWTGRTGIGVRKRAASPSASERMAKMAKMAEAHDHASFRDRARQEYQERQAEGRLIPAQRTCATLDEKAGRKFNVLSLNTQNIETFPEGLIDMLEDDLLVKQMDQSRHQGSIEGRLRARMQADALQPIAPNAALDSTDLASAKDALSDAISSPEDLEECTAFLRLSAKDRLSLVLDYLRDRYMYCFWCGTQYDNEEDMEITCPGREEEDHD